MPTPVTVEYDKISSYFTHFHKLTMMKSKSKTTSKKYTTVKSYCKSNSFIVSTHTRHYTIAVTPINKAKVTKNILKIYNCNNDDSSVAFNIHLKDNLKFVRKAKSIKFTLFEYANDASIAQHLHIKELKQFFK